MGSTLKKKLGARIQEIRKAQKITQDRLAEQIEMDTPNLSNIECGKRFMTADTLEKIANVLNIPEYELFNFEHCENQPILKNKILEKLDSYSEKELQFLYKVINNIIELR